MGTQDLVLFRGFDVNLKSGLWETDGTSANTWEILVPGAYDVRGPIPSNFAALGTKVLFEAYDQGGTPRLWVTDGTSPGTSVISIPGAHFSIPGDIAVLGNKALFVASTGNQSFLWTTDGTAAGTSQIPGSDGASGHLTLF